VVPLVRVCARAISDSRPNRDQELEEGKKLSPSRGLPEWLSRAPEEEIVGEVDALLSDGSTWLNGHSFIDQEFNRSQIGFHTNNKAFTTGGRRRLLEAASDRRSSATNSTTGRASWTKFRTLGGQRVEAPADSRLPVLRDARCNWGSGCSLVHE
jgi:hypothetical protein